MKKIKEKELKEITWIYFIQQKVLELLLIPAIVMIPYLVGDFAGNLWSKFFGIPTFPSAFSLWLFGIFNLILFILIISTVFTLINNWIVFNWNWANEKAKRYLKNERRSK